MIITSGSLVCSGGMKMQEIDISGLSLPELTELLHRIADEIQLRAMEEAGQA